MSYNLYFLPAEGGSILSGDEFQGWFRSRPHYHLDGCQAFYVNPETGVSFQFEHAAPSTADGEERAGFFMLNGYRPHVFGLEAEPEVKAFVEEFSLRVDDSEAINGQPGGMTSGEYSPEGFLRDYDVANQFVYAAALAQQPPGTIPPAMAREDLERCWRWNLIQEALQASHQAQVFVPPISLAIRAGKVCSLVVWPDVIPIALPKVDLIIFSREVRPARAEPDGAITAWDEVPWKDVESQDVTGTTTAEGEEHLLLDWGETPPEAFVKWIDGLPPLDEALEGVTTDQVLTAEMLEKARSES